MNRNEEQVISISNALESLKKRWLIILLITLISTIVAVVLSFFVIKPTYETSTKVFIGKEESSTEGYNSNDIAMYQRLLKTYSEAIKTKDLVNRAIEGSEFDLDTNKILDELTVVPVTDTQILQIKYISKNQEEAEDTLKRITDEFIKTSKILVPNGNVKVIESVIYPKNPVSPNKKMNIAIAFMLGVMASCGLVFLIEYMDNSFKSKEQLEQELNIPVLGVIPNIDME